MFKYIFEVLRTSVGQIYVIRMTSLGEKYTKMALKYRFGMSQFRNRCPNCFDVNTIRQASGVDVF